MLPVRRDIQFDFPAERIGNWHADGVAITQFFNALSVAFPDGERFFIHAVRQFRNQISDPQLKAAVTAFIGQEAMHGREHEHWNALYFERVPAARKINAFASKRLQRWKRWLPKTTQLAMTIGAEHVTAVLGDYILRHPEVLNGRQGGSEPVFVAMLRWHAMEETEHKAVAYDVWKSVMRRNPRAYLERSLGLAFMLAAYWPVMNKLIIEGIKAETGSAPDGADIARLKAFLYGSQGLMRNLAIPMLSYFRPGFHPWDDDNRELLAEMDSIEAAYAA